MSPYFCVIGFRKKGRLIFLSVLFGADDEARTRYLHLGKVALYRMSYTRISNAGVIIAENSEKSRPVCQIARNFFILFRIRSGRLRVRRVVCGRGVGRGFLRRCIVCRFLRLCLRRDLRLGLRAPAGNTGNAG